jgi:hypothetical protein
MMRQELDVKVREKLELKMERLQRKLEELRGDGELQEQLDGIVQALAQVEADLSVESDLADETLPDLRARLEAQRERLLAKKERLELKLELLAERRERLHEALEDIQESLLHDDFGAGFSHTSRVPASGFTDLHEERRKILEMVQAGTISAEEGSKLLDALVEQGSQRRRRPRWVRIRVTDTSANKVRVNLTLPVGLVRAGLRAGGNIAGVEGLNKTNLEEMLNRGEIGHLVDVVDKEDGERVEIFVE